MKNLTADDEIRIEEMADQMLRYGEGCTRDQLSLHFTADEIDRLAARARNVANTRMIRQTRARMPGASPRPAASRRSERAAA